MIILHDTFIDIKDFFPFWDKLSDEHKDDLEHCATCKAYSKGEILNPAQKDCIGLILVRKGQLRAFALSESGREVTLYRLFDRDICMFSASCIMNSVQFDIHIEVEKDTESFLLSPSVYQRLTQQSLLISNYTNEVMSSRFTDVLWTLEQIVFKSMDSRLAFFLLEQMAVEGAVCIAFTHDEIARNLGTAREVVTRLLKNFQTEGLVELSRGKIKLTDVEGLQELSQSR